MAGVVRAGSERSLLVVVDPQKAFTHPEGSLARAYGSAEIEPCVRALEGLRSVLRRLAPERVDTLLVQSEYRPGQFTDGDLDHPLARLCVPGTIDCELADGLDTWAPTFHIVKRSPNAYDAPEYIAVVSRLIEHGLRDIWFAGFMFTSCVAQTALATHDAYRGQGIRCGVLTSVSGIRRSSLHRQPDGTTRVERVEGELLRAGIRLVRAAELLPARGGGLQA